jgi:hypothetical protein
MSVTTELRRLLDRQEITELVYRLGACLDDARFDAMRALLVDGAAVRTPGGTATGREAVIAQARRNHPPQDRVQHVITNPIVELDGDRAEVRANLVVPFASAPAGGGQPAPAAVRFALGEVYRFRAVRTVEGWRLSRIEVTPVWGFGELDQPRAS